MVAAATAPTPTLTTPPPLRPATTAPPPLPVIRVTITGDRLDGLRDGDVAEFERIDLADLADLATVHDGTIVLIRRKSGGVNAMHFDGLDDGGASVWLACAKENSRPVERWLDVVSSDDIAEISELSGVVRPVLGLCTARCDGSAASAQQKGREAHPHVQLGGKNSKDAATTAV